MVHKMTQEIVSMLRHTEAPSALATDIETDIKTVIKTERLKTDNSYLSLYI